MGCFADKEENDDVLLPNLVTSKQNQKITVTVVIVRMRCASGDLFVLGLDCLREIERWV